MSRIAVFPGSFDPLTTGHLDLIDRGCRLFDRLIVAVAVNPRKSSLFSTEERLAMIREAVVHQGDRVEADAFDGLLVQYARTKGACAILRGLRVVSDFEFEFQMASMNRRLAPELETLLVIPSENNHYISSSMVKEVAAFGGEIDGLVPACVKRLLLERIGRSPTAA
ncbi:MAG: pantetheine-phosphate adenylyltransferase [Myxococcota bacterium]|jgi:pantetheine-phosphate adenylyltransferase|nr:pantetheine-phosphate adenylyltransferase [Myxococcota bacterium]